MDERPKHCRHVDWASYASIRGHRYVVCTSCGVARLDPVPDEDEAAQYYTAAYFSGRLAGGYSSYEADEQVHRRNGRRRLVRLAKLGLLPPGRLIDVGCALGFALDEARAAGWDVAGVEVSDFARDYAQSRFSAEVRSELAEFLHDLEGEVDVITMYQVLEHTVSPAGTLSTCAALLRPGGALLIETWDRSSLVARVLGRHWQQLNPPSVLWAFSRRAIVELLEGHGFGSVEIKIASKYVSLAIVMRILSDRYPGALGWLDRVARRYPGLGATSLPYGLGDLVTVSAVRQ